MIPATKTGDAVNQAEGFAVMQRKLPSEKGIARLRV